MRKHEGTSGTIIALIREKGRNLSYWQIDYHLPCVNVHFLNDSDTFQRLKPINADRYWEIQEKWMRDVKCCYNTKRLGAIHHCLFCIIRLRLLSKYSYYDIKKNNSGCLPLQSIRLNGKCVNTNGAAQVLSDLQKHSHSCNLTEFFYQSTRKTIGKIYLCFPGENRNWWY